VRPRRASLTWLHRALFDVARSRHLRSTVARFCCALAAIVVIAAPPARSAQTQGPTSPDASLSIVGRVEHPLTLHLSDLEQFPQKTIKVHDEKGVAASYEGVAVADLLRQAAAPLGAQLRGPQMRLYVVIKAADGYQAVFALPEFDPDFTDRLIILAFRRDGNLIGSSEGPLRIVVPGEKRHARWVKQVTVLDVEQAE